uniref:Uncharacterized protein n=1 Tax=Fundulus heteroclitus TaxID=8078 RepID=A0A146TFT2_FUNHE
MPGTLELSPFGWFLSELLNLPRRGSPQEADCRGLYLCSGPLGHALYFMTTGEGRNTDGTVNQRLCSTDQSTALQTRPESWKSQPVYGRGPQRSKQDRETSSWETERNTGAVWPTRLPVNIFTEKPYR